jgi:broad specificity phosphatase PhoE
MAFELVLIQHGLTDWNLRRWSQGHSDVPLNGTGRAQAEALAERLAAERFDALYASDMQRTVDSLAPLATRLGMEVRQDWRLREGRWARHRKHPEVPVLPFPVEKEEPADVLRRLCGFLQEVQARHPDGRVLVMGHGAVLMRLIHHLEATAPWPYPPFDARKMAVNILRLRGDGTWEVVRCNDDAHLRSQGLDKGRRSRRHTYRVFAWRAGQVARICLPGFLHPAAQRLLRRITARDRILALEPTANLPVGWNEAPEESLAQATP